MNRLVSELGWDKKFGQALPEVFKGEAWATLDE